ncbi:AAA family ATPase [Gordonia crocea]|uniref:Uncharacterized protein n=1 Tax=Gordonia crocea TaxID=589162 RepID=A0A7M3SUX9_9ACTN|nr:AAA family ATPase [Gordonia crocea]GED96453.1 hypothetical protein nbrc107697_04920 [Gordonia crocea]
MGQALDYLDHRGEMDDEVIVIDDFERYLDIGVFARKVALASGEFGARFLLVVDERHTFRFNEVSAELADAAHIVTVDQLPADELPDIVAHAVAPLARATRVDIDREVITAALAPADASEPRRHPGLAIRRIDEAIGRARLEGTRTLRADHLALPKVERPQGANALARRLARRVRGQDEAIATVARFVGPALAGLKDQPGAPHATLMFAGPTGVGKTELAKELAAAAYGSSDALIALDMSEYADAQDGLAKLIGHHRSWKNSSTEGLLTTRVIERPRSVVLLDEFEKSHPMVWQTFLQVFDEGRLTDGWGQTASFSEAIIILTSNLGARDGASRGAGFGATGGFRADKQLAAIAERFPPELRNRITAIVPFVPLDLDAIVEICEAELARAAERFGSAGWRIDYDDDVVRRLAEAGFDPALGARHIKRNIRGELLPLLADASTRDVRVVAGVDGLSLECAA